MLANGPRYQKEIRFKCRRWMNMNVYDFKNSKALAEEAASEFDLDDAPETPEWILKAAKEVFTQKRG